MHARKIIGVTAGVLTAVALGTGSGCEYRDPCAVLPPPTSVEQSAAAGGAQVEREIENGNAPIECDLVNGRWVQERDR